jgi:serine/threonine-protein kinase
VIGRYRILGEIGGGGMGKVFKAQDPALDRVVALKVPHFNGPDHLQAQLRQRFQREARAAAKVQHPQLCPVYDVGEQDGRPFVVMAYLEGLTLAETLKRPGAYAEPREAVSLIQAVLDPLRSLHAQGIIHRDLKPSNIMLGQDGRPVLMDFGLARLLGDLEQLTPDGALVGTPSYMAPEQAASQSDQIGPWTDLYSLGVILYRMLTGRLPFQGPLGALLAQILHDLPPRPSALRPDLDPGLEAIMLKALAKEPSDRYQNTDQLREALKSGTSSPSAGQGPTGVAQYELIQVEHRGEVFIVNFPRRYWSPEKNQEAGKEIMGLVERQGCRKLVLSLDTIDYGPSILFSVLVRLLRRLQDYDGRLILCDVKPLVREVLRLNRLEGYFEFAADRDSALCELEGP